MVGGMNPGPEDSCCAPLQFSSLEPEVLCRLVYVKDVQMSSCGEAESAGLQALQPGATQTELPTCPVCLDRLDEETSGLVTTVRTPLIL